MMSLRKRIAVVVACSALPLLLIAGFIGFRSEDTQALSGSSFKAGHIIDDAVFYDGDALSESQIQSFLNSKMPDCDTNGEEEYNGTGMTRAEWTEANNRPEPPYTCLKSYTAKVLAKPADAYCDGSINSSGSTKKKAAYIIRIVANACNVSPKVLIVTLQKEQGLVTDDWPWPTQYAKAMGFGCPDTDLPHSDDSNNNGCYDDFEGFFNQVYYAARQFQRYVKQSQNYNHRVGKTSSLLSYPNCNKSNVLIQTKATAALYNYTPYQPNQAALSNLYGTGNTCSYYGNRNFWRYFNDWFGSPYASYKAQEVYKCCKVSSLPGITRTITLEFKNTGQADWYDETGSEQSSAPFGTLPVMLMTGNPVQRSSRFSSSSWTGDNKPARDFAAVYESNGSTLAGNQHLAKPGQIVRYVFNLEIPADTPPGVYKEYFQPVVFQKPTLIKSPGTYIYMNIQKPVYSGQILGKDSSVETDPGQTVQSYIRIKNTGNMPWYDSDSIGSAGPGVLPTMLVTSDPLMHYHSFGSLWGSARNVPTRNFAQVYNSNNTLASNQNIVMPGQWAWFNVDFYVPTTSGSKTKKDYFMLTGREKVGGKWKIIPYSGTETALSVVVN